VVVMAEVVMAEAAARMAEVVMVEAGQQECRSRSNYRLQSSWRSGRYHLNKIIV
jgi:hypothetical protein